MADNFYGPEDMAEYYRMTKPNILTDGLYVARDGNLAKMETKYILPKGATVCWMGGNPTNADHIRSMTDEELAKWMSANVANYARRKFSETGVIEEYGENGLIAKSWLDWLKEECEA